MRCGIGPTVLADSTPSSKRRTAARLGSRVLIGIVFVLRSGIPWQMLPPELGCGSGMTCWRRLHEWQLAGVGDLIHFALLDWLAQGADQGDTTTIQETLPEAAEQLEAVADVTKRAVAVIEESSPTRGTTAASRFTIWRRWEFARTSANPVAGRNHGPTNTPNVGRLSTARSMRYRV